MSYGFRLRPTQYFRSTFILMLLVSVICGISSIVQIYAVSGFVDHAIALAGGSSWNLKMVLVLLVLILTIAVEWMMPMVNSLLQKRAEVLLIQNYRPIVMQKCAKIKFEHFENAGKWDLISRAVTEPEKQWINICNAITELMKLAISIVGILAIIASDVWWAAIVILVFCLPIFILAFKGGKKNYEAKQDASEYIRKYNYFDKVLYEKNSLEERKLFGYTDYVEEMYESSFKKAFWIETKMQMQWAIKTKLSGGLSMIAALLIVVTLISPTVDGKLSIGMFISLVNGVFLLTSQMSWGLSRSIDRLVAGREYKKDMENFFALEEDEGALDLPEYVRNIETIEFRNVSFIYPEASNYILKNLSFTMERGKKYALVGANGAGKTTIVKLLLGLYSDYSGEILINGRNQKQYTRAQLKGMFSTVFQDYIKHSLTILENFDLADPNRRISMPEITELLERFELDQAVRQLPSGLYSKLGKIEEDGVELSGGQWQKIAMIRALLRPAEIQIMDEPTAALDPKMESEIYRMFQALANDKLTILISHRLGFAKHADEIIVLEDGSVCEKGNFDALMRNNGLFCNMYNEQRRWYEE